MEARLCSQCQRGEAQGGQLCSQYHRGEAQGGQALQPVSDGRDSWRPGTAASVRGERHMEARLYSQCQKGGAQGGQALRPVSEGEAPGGQALRPVSEGEAPGGQALPPVSEGRGTGRRRRNQPSSLQGSHSAGAQSSAGGAGTSSAPSKDLTALELRAPQEAQEPAQLPPRISQHWSSELRRRRRNQLSSLQGSHSTGAQSSAGGAGTSSAPSKDLTALELRAPQEAQEPAQLPPRISQHWSSELRRRRRNQLSSLQGSHSTGAQSSAGGAGTSSAPSKDLTALELRAPQEAQEPAQLPPRISPGLELRAPQEAQEPAQLPPRISQHWSSELRRRRRNQLSSLQGSHSTGAQSSAGGAGTSPATSKDLTGTGAWSSAGGAGTSSAPSKDLTALELRAQSSAGGAGTSSAPSKDLTALELRAPQEAQEPAQLPPRISQHWSSELRRRRRNQPSYLQGSHSTGAQSSAGGAGTSSAPSKDLTALELRAPQEAQEPAQLPPRISQHWSSELRRRRRNQPSYLQGSHQDWSSELRRRRRNQLSSLQGSHSTGAQSSAGGAGTSSAPSKDLTALELRAPQEAQEPAQLPPRISPGLVLGALQEAQEPAQLPPRISQHWSSELRALQEAQEPAQLPPRISQHWSSELRRRRRNQLSSLQGSHSTGAQSSAGGAGTSPATSKDLTGTGAWSSAGGAGTSSAPSKDLTALELRAQSSAGGAGTSSAPSKDLTALELRAPQEAQEPAQLPPRISQHWSSELRRRRRNQLSSLQGSHSTGAQSSAGGAGTSSAPSKDLTALELRAPQEAQEPAQLPPRISLGLVLGALQEAQEPAQLPPRISQHWSSELCRRRRNQLSSLQGSHSTGAQSSAGGAGTSSAPSKDLTALELRAPQEAQEPAQLPPRISPGLVLGALQEAQEPAHLPPRISQHWSSELCRRRRNQLSSLQGSHSTGAQSSAGGAGTSSAPSKALTALELRAPQEAQEPAQLPPRISPGLVLGALQEAQEPAQLPPRISPGLVLGALQEAQEPAQLPPRISQHWSSELRRRRRNQLSSLQGSHSTGAQSSAGGAGTSPATSKDLTRTGAWSSAGGAGTSSAPSKDLTALELRAPQEAQEPAQFPPRISQDWSSELCRRRRNQLSQDTGLGHVIAACMLPHVPRHQDTPSSALGARTRRAALLRVDNVILKIYRSVPQVHEPMDCFRSRPPAVTQVNRGAVPAFRGTDSKLLPPAALNYHRRQRSPKHDPSW
ncbi:hypothetical protein NDU88_000195 [Pleurodeles waltl]|uniref:Uncharacterized protein n=1 Tax=Pleurodeles waltl TaxID=8319 RepID=A0AAV7LW71_PLEWA|nr:hypothetical protein NDU88_000195 [Pleurodeles waltl]